MSRVPQGAMSVPLLGRRVRAARRTAPTHGDSLGAPLSRRAPATALRATHLVCSCRICHRWRAGTPVHTRWVTPALERRAAALDVLCELFPQRDDHLLPRGERCLKPSNDARLHNVEVATTANLPHTTRADDASFSGRRTCAYDVAVCLQRPAHVRVRRGGVRATSRSPSFSPLLSHGMHSPQPPSP